MSWELALRHCAALKASVDQTRVSCELIAAQLVGFEAFCRQQVGPRASASPLPARCAAYQADLCGRQTPEAVIALGGMSTAAPQQMCRGCGLDPSTS